MDNLNQLRQIIGLKFHRILFDNMTPKTIVNGIKLSKKCMRLRHRRHYIKKCK